MNSTRTTSRFWIVTGFVALAVFASFAIFMREQQRSIVAAALADSRLNSTGPARPLAEVATAMRAMKLVTVEIDTRVKVERGDTSWRGDVSASVEVPVRISFGTDLSGLTTEAVTFSPVMPERGAYVVRIPRPVRVATEVFSEKEQALVETGWLRLRSQAGEYYLGQARKGVSEQARELVLLPEDAEHVDRVTREQVKSVVKSIVGDTADVVVVYAEEGGS